ncbi:hypothetical protein QF012_002059 [Pseudomonas laurylsulfatiphila]
MSVSNAMSSEFPAAHWSGQPTGTAINLQQKQATAVPNDPSEPVGIRAWEIFPHL